jgi:energy-coupling factor transport system ATP-binding protein
MIEIETQNIWFSYSDASDSGPVDVLKSVSLQITKGEFVALIGQNGSGKTTLAKHLLGLLRPREGKVLIHSEDIAGKAVGEVARSVGYVFQNPDHQIFSATTRDEISYGPQNLHLDEAEIVDRSDQAMDRFDLSAYAKQQPATLSHGIRRKVALASIYAMDPKIWILDEPTGGLDWRSEQETMALLHELNEAGKTIVLITHDMRLVADHTERCIVMSEGQVVAHDATRAVMEQDEALRITPPQTWRLGSALDLQPPPLTVEAFCREYGKKLAAEREIDVGRA